MPKNWPKHYILQKQLLNERPSILSLGAIHTKSPYFNFDWDYEDIYFYLIGAELNISWYAERPERFAPYNRAKVIILYPSPFYKKVPAWGKHFIAYVRGATGVRDLKDLGVDE